MREQVIMECTEAAAEGKPASRYFTTKNPKSIKKKEGRMERKKYNKFLKRHTVHREKK